MLTLMRNKLKWAYVGPTLDISGTNKWVGLVKAWFGQISSVDKLISTNKLIQNSNTTQTGDRIDGLF